MMLTQPPVTIRAGALARRSEVRGYLQVAQVVNQLDVRWVEDRSLFGSIFSVYGSDAVLVAKVIAQYV